MFIISLFAILSHQSFDWSCRTKLKALVSNMGEVVRDMSRVSQVNITRSSPLYVAANKIYHMARAKKNVKKVKESFLESHRDILEKYEVKIDENEGEKSDKGQSVAKKKNPIQSEVNKRKNFDDLKSAKSKRARVKSVIEILEEDQGLEEKVLEKLENRKAGGKSGNEDFGISCLALIKIMGISNTKYDDLRWWLQDMLRRKMDLSSMPTSKQLMEKVQAEMVPRNMETSETGASVPLTDAVYHQAERLLIRWMNPQINIFFPFFLSFPLIDLM